MSDPTDELGPETDRKESPQAKDAALLNEIDHLNARILNLEHSLAIRIVRAYWTLVNRFFPVGTGRRRLYQWIRRQTWLGLRLLARPLRGYLHPAPPQAPGAPVPVPTRIEEPPLLVVERLAETRPSDRTVVVLSGTQLREDEGQRPTQIALDLARRGLPVVFGYFRWDRNEWLPQTLFDAGIAQIPLDVLTEHPEALARSFAGRERIALFTFPHPSFFELASSLNAGGWITLYDVLDDWEEFHRVGQAEWYDREFEGHLVRAVDGVFTVNAVLAERMEELGCSNPEVIGNGLRTGIDRIKTPRSLERGEVTVGYFGYLSPAWFDWELIGWTARQRPTWRFYIIGYGTDTDEIDLPGNVRFLGKIPQMELAGYAANWDVAIIPFKAEKLAEGADPIKTYEYLAMGLPVVVTGVVSPEGAERLVSRATDQGSFVSLLERAAAERETLAPEGRAFAARNTWSQRVDAILDLIEDGRQRVCEKRFLAERSR